MEEVKHTMILTFVYYVVICSFALVTGFPEQGLKTVKMSLTTNITAMSKIMYNETKIYVKVESDVDLTVSWLLRYSPCMEEYLMDDQPIVLYRYLTHPAEQLIPHMPYNHTEYMTNSSLLVKNHLYIGDYTKDHFRASSMTQHYSGQRRKKRANAKITPSTKTTKTTTTTTTPAPTKKAMNSEKIPLLKTWKDGPYIFVLHLESSEKDFTAKITIWMVGKHGLISAVDHPLLVFYGVMGFFYIMYGVIWLVLLACSWRDLLRIQFWIGGVILLGMLEKAVFYGEYQSVSNSGKSVPGAIVFAELVSCVKRALARMLVIITSLGFGIVKPRLGAAFHKVLFVGGVYLISSAIEGCYRALNPTQVNNSTLLILNIPLAIVDAVICWWIFSSLVQTTRTLRLRRNVVKLSLYRHFTNLLIFAVLSSVIFMIWSLIQHRLKKCITDWQEIWIDDAFWHLLFSVILLTMMFLWRPSEISQRYAFSPLLDADEEEEDTTMNDAFGVGAVVKSSNPKYSEGDLVCCQFGWPWSLYFVKKPDTSMQKIDKSLVGEKPSYCLSVLSLTGLTSYLGITEKGHIKPGHTLVVSGAAGACGSLAGQFGRLEGCERVVGICGSDEKCKYLTSELDFNGAINYKTMNIEEELCKQCPHGIDVYFDNVGGSISDQVIKQMNKDSHVILCGQISVYNKDVPYPPPIPEETEQKLKQNNITRERFLVLNYPEKFDEALKKIGEWLFTGKIKVKETIANGLVNAGPAFVSMMNGGNIGKQLVFVDNL